MRWVSAKRITIIVLAMFTIGIQLAGRSEGSDNWKAPPHASRKQNPIRADEKSIERGKAAYAANCLACHGRAGKGDGPKAADVQPRPSDLSCARVAGQSDGALFWKITEGRRPMPAFRSLLPDNDRWDVVNYVRTLEPRGSSARNH